MRCLQFIRATCSLHRVWEQRRRETSLEALTIIQVRDGVDHGGHNAGRKERWMLDIR